MVDGSVENAVRRDAGLGHRWRASETTVRRRAAASCLARCAHCDPLPQPRSWRVRGGSRRVPGYTAEAVRPRRQDRCPKGVGPHPRPGTPRGLGHTQDPAPRRGLDHTQDQAPPGGWATLRTRHPEGGWAAPRLGHPEGVGRRNGPQLAQRVSQLAAERTPDSPGGPAPPVAGLRDNGAAPRGGKLSRSLRSLRPIAAASVVAGPRRFPEGAWIHRRGGPATTPGPVPEGGWTTPKTRHPQGVGPHSGAGTPTGVGPHPKPSTPQGLGDTDAPATRRGFDP